MRAYWEARDPITLFEKYLFLEKLLDLDGKKEMERKIEALLAKERDFAENSPMPPPELAAEGVYCTGDDCHRIRPKWERPVSEVTPPESSVAAVWTVPGFGSGQGSGGGQAPLHFGDTPRDRGEARPDREAPRAVGAAQKPRPAKPAPSKPAPKKSLKTAAPAAGKSVARKVRK